MALWLQKIEVCDANVTAQHNKYKAEASKS